MISTLTRRQPRQPKPLTRERILRAAKNGNLQPMVDDGYMHYRPYYEVAWRERVQLVKDMADEGLLREANFEPQLIGDEPAFLVSNPRITANGLEQLEKLQQRKWRFVWSFLLAVVATVTVGLILYWLKRG